MARCDYANARIGGLRARLLGPRGLRELASLPSLEARLERLRGSDYAPAVPPRGGAEPLAATERGLRELVRREPARLAGFLEGAVPRRLLGAHLSVDDAEALKTVFRGLRSGTPAERVLALADPGPGLPEALLHALASAPDARAAAAILERAGHPAHAAAAAALPELDRPGGLLRLEVSLDRGALARAAAEARGPGEDRALFRSVLALRVDLANAATLLKLDGVGDPSALFLAGGARVDRRRFEALARLPRGPLAERLEAMLAAAGAAAALASPLSADEALRRLPERWLAGEARRRPLSLAVALWFAFARRAEVRRIRLVLRGAEFGLPADDLLGLLEA